MSQRSTPSRLDVREETYIETWVEDNRNNKRPDYCAVYSVARHTARMSVWFAPAKIGERAAAPWNLLQYEHGFFPSGSSSFAIVVIVLVHIDLI